MKIKIRYGCFESNSSSSHSICITKNSHILTAEDFEDYPEHMWIDKYGMLELAYNEDELSFERHPFMFLNTFKDKLRFAVASLCNQYANKTTEERDKKFQEILEVAQKINPQIKGIDLPKHEVHVWFDEAGNKVSDSIVHYDYDNDRYFYVKDGHEWHVTESDEYTYEPYYGYVDHQSMGLLENFLEKEQVSLEDFLGNRKYVVIIDGDEMCDWDKLKYSGLINITNIEKEFGYED